MDEGGRGLELVELISDAWGVREPGVPEAPDPEGGPAAPPNPLLALLPRQAQGKAVWFHLAG
jgi:hypothetical protein